MESLKIGVHGISGTGKTYWTKNELIPSLVRKKPVVIFDRVGEYAGPNKKDVKFNPELYQGFGEFYEKMKATRVLEKKIHVIHCMDDSDYIQGIAFFKILKKPVSLILEEAHDIFKASEFARTKSRVIQICRYGRHWGIDLALISQRSKDIVPDIRSQFEAVVSFKQTFQSDIDTLKEIGGDEAEGVLDLEQKEFKILGNSKKLTKILKK